ncbi:AAA family ATPase [Thalassotalea sp. 1_MG-2023]|uniref:AAA family ATPase n=1 Tax=Thalassotalea sp. 1_MG-2023 TaxID=3062680 RepID=UPI0026E42A47|nr:AAA family ATPase [Thalassotalea sp. 1_MG-2023]MDO6428086.1 AAA family ATPase [Thalassotalea sp. 1_MG-2023]
MYTAYFGLSEAPFTIAPDPAYLFLSDRHREALSHLTYGLGDNGGFVLLTGEVGTGKTTISRTVMEKLPENTQLAFILNPTLSCEELLATICDNLKIRYKKTGATLKYLTDKIQQKLISNHEQGINTLVIIDEAQHLQAEVLEQLRLLTNLETNTKKLLQVILIGQPELQQLLQRRDLRQLAQRITARYHLMPLTQQELTNYIQHRLSVANCTRSLFNKGAIAAIHKISQGIPRVVNLLCDRALVLAYSDNQAVVNRKIVIEAAHEALGEAVQPSLWQSLSVKVAIMSVTVILSLLIGVWLADNGKFFNDDEQVLSNPTHTNQGQSDQLVPATHTKQETTDSVESRNSSHLANNLPQQKERHANQTEISQAIDIVDKKNLPDEKIIESVETEEKTTAPLVLGYNAQAYQEQQKKSAITLKAEEGVSEEILELFKEAVKETEDEPLDKIDSQSVNNVDYSSVTALHQMPATFQDALPPLSFEMHMFETEGNGWVRVNGSDFKEGEYIANNILLEAILPQRVILNFKGEQFSMPALSNW